MADILVNNNFYISTSDACIIDITAPTFAGINFLDVESRGQIRAGWSVATDPTPPIRYEVYIKAGTATGLFSTSNIVGITPNLQYDIFTMPDGSFLVNGTTYYVGVRALDGVSNRDSNTVSMSVISTGVLTSIDVYECKGTWSTDTSNNFLFTAWANKNSSLAIAPDAVLGTASYQVYDKTGAAIVGMSGSGVSANAQGLFVFPSVPNLMSLDHQHNEIKITISIDGENRVNFIGTDEKEETYSINGTCDVDDSNNLVGGFWVTQNERVVSTGLGTGSYQAYTASGVIIPGLSESGIVADGNGYFAITPFSMPGTVDITKAYVVRITATVNGELRSTNIVLGNEPANYTCKATFSINASNMLEASLWANKNDVMPPVAVLGTASYQIYDKTGAAVVGLSESGLTADVNGLYHITPVAATLLTDLTHYTAKITISVAGQNRVAFKGFTLLGN